LGEIKEGSIVRYSGTGTVGVVKALKTDEDGQWAFLDSTGMYYLVSTLETLDRMPEKREIGVRTIEDFEKMAEAEKEQMATIKMEDEGVESGG